MTNPSEGRWTHKKRSTPYQKYVIDDPGYGLETLIRISELDKKTIESQINESYGIVDAELKRKNDVIEDLNARVKYLESVVLGFENVMLHRLGICQKVALDQIDERRASEVLNIDLESMNVLMDSYNRITEGVRKKLESKYKDVTSLQRFFLNASRLVKLTYDERPQVEVVRVITDQIDDILNDSTTNES